MDNQILLEMKNIKKTFPGVKALDGVSLSLRKGEVHALLGENGAGKSTLIKVLAGINIPDEGEIYIEGEKTTLFNVESSQNAGISVIHQEISLIPKLTVAQNIFLGREGKTFFINENKILKQARDLFEEFGFDIDVRAKVSDLSIAQQQIVEIVRALSINAKAIVMDEPTASISEEDTRKLFNMIKKLKAKGVSIIYISHRMEEIFEIADRITVIRDGSHVGTVEATNTSRETLISMMVGRELKEIFHYDIKEVKDTILKLHNVSNKRLQSINLSLRKGEILGLSGLVGSGRTEIAKAIFGIDDFEGEIYINGEKRSIRSPSDAMDAGIALIPESRKEQGLILENTISFNMLLLSLGEFIKGFWINKEKAVAITKEYAEKLKLKANSLESKVSTLSGGNQQKVVLSKWLANNPRIIILDEPTRGIDVGTKFEIYDLMFKLVKQGISIILISSELSEIINLSTRVIVIRDGKNVAELDRSELSQEKIMYFATGGV